eukprot:UN15012
MGDYKYGIPKIRTAVPAFVVFGLVGFWSSRHRMIYSAEQSGPRDEQTTISASLESSSQPSPQRVLLMVALLAMSSHVAWMSSLRNAANAWGEIQLHLVSPTYRGACFGFRSVTLSYSHALVGSIGLQA